MLDNLYTAKRAGYHMRRHQHYGALHNKRCQIGLGLTTLTQKFAELHVHHGRLADKYAQERADKEAGATVQAAPIP